MTRSIFYFNGCKLYVQNTFKMNAPQMCIWFISFCFAFFLGFCGRYSISDTVNCQLDIFFFCSRLKIYSHLIRSNFNRIRIKKDRVVLQSDCDHTRFDCSVYAHKWSVVSVMNTVHWDITGMLYFVSCSRIGISSRLVLFLHIFSLIFALEYQTKSNPDFFLSNFKYFHIWNPHQLL